MFMTSCFENICFLFQENVVLCGLRNGTVLAIDIRQKPGDFSGRLPQNRIPCHPDGHSSRVKSSARDSFQVSNAFVRSCVYILFFLWTALQPSTFVRAMMNFICFKLWAWFELYQHLKMSILKQDTIVGGVLSLILKHKVESHFIIRPSNIHWELTKLVILGGCQV